MSVLPTVAAARAVDPALPDPEPVEAALAALTLSARIQRREVSTQRIEIAAARIEKMRRTPRPAAVPSSHAVLGNVLERRACTLCTVRPGFGPCPFCTGTGCDECEGQGFTKCTACDGAREIAIAELHMIDDRELRLRATYAPSVPLSLDALLREAIDDSVDPPDALTFDLDRSSVFAPYREARVDADSFEGHSFGDALLRARAQLERIREGGQQLEEELHAWARPFLLLTWPEHPPALVLADGTGAVSVLR